MDASTRFRTNESARYPSLLLIWSGLETRPT
jgi:hypothetical protein